MNAIFLAVCIISLAVLGYKLMGRLDRYFDDGADAGRTKQTPPCALVYADERDLADIERQLLPYGAHLQYTAKPVLPENGQILALLAVSANDLDNILLCALAGKRYAAMCYARCNHMPYLPVYRDYPMACVAGSREMALTQFERFLKERFLEHD